MEINITLIIVGIVALLELVKGYKRGMVKEIASSIALVVTVFVLALLLMLFSSFQDGEARNTIYSIILLVVIGLVYGIVSLIMKSAKALTKLPVINIANSLLGAVLGLVKTVLILWIVFLLYSEGYLEAIEQTIQSDIETSSILTWLYEKNIFLQLRN